MTAPIGVDGARLVTLAEVPFEMLCAYDRSCFPADRAGFLKGWIPQHDALALGAVRDGALTGYGVIRRCREGCKVGPLFGDDARVAAALYDALAAFGAGGAVFLDVPENNPDAIALARARGMSEVFGCARMYLGPVPAIRHERVFGVTTFELG